MPHSKLRPQFLFLLAIIFYACYMLLMQPTWVLGGEMWAEMATNFYANANSHSWINKLFATDAGYIPFPQRLVALIGDQFQLPASSIPFFYTWSAILIAGMMVGAFCLEPYRRVIEDDLFRFFIVLAVLMAADFETRTFVSFTYFGAFFVLVTSALTFKSRFSATDVPWWAWCIPLMVLSKPAVLATMPAMAVSAWFSKSRFRYIFIASGIICLLQLAQMYSSSLEGVMPFRSAQIDFMTKLFITIKYFFGFLGLYITGPFIQQSKQSLIFFGALYFFFFCCLLFFAKWRNGFSLIFIGISCIFFNTLINVFAIPDFWNEGLAVLHGAPIERHKIVGFFGAILVVAGLIDCQRIFFFGFLKSKTNYFLCLIFLIWFIISGWFSYAAKISREPIAPLLNLSQWQNMSNAIDSGVTPLCVPINPWLGVSWLYQRHCDLLNPAPSWSYGSKKLIEPLVIDISPPMVSGSALVAGAMFIKPLTRSKEFIQAKMIFQMRDGKSIYFSGQQWVIPSGGLLLFTGDQTVFKKNVQSIRIVFSLPVEIASSPVGHELDSGLALLGY